MVLRVRVEQDLQKKYSPEQIAGRLRDDHPDDPEMWVSTETIYQSLYVQSRSALRRDLAKCLRTGRGLRQPNRQGAQRKNRVLHDMVNIAERPAEADDRAVPGHWEGDLVRHEALCDRAEVKDRAPRGAVRPCAGVRPAPAFRRSGAVEAGGSRIR